MEESRPDRRADAARMPAQNLKYGAQILPFKHFRFPLQAELTNEKDNGKRTERPNEAC